MASLIIMKYLYLKYYSVIWKYLLSNGIISVNRACTKSHHHDPYIPVEKTDWEYYKKATLYSMSEVNKYWEKNTPDFGGESAEIDDD